MTGFVYAKMCFNVANNVFNIPVFLITNLLVLDLWLQKYTANHLYVTIACFFIVPVAFVLLGHVYIAKGWFRHEQRLSNEHNPQLEEIRKAVLGKR